MDLTTTIIIIVVLTLVLFITVQILKRTTQKKMITAIQKGNTDEFLAIADGKLIGFLFPRFNIEYLKLNAYILEGNKRKIMDQFDLLLKGIRKSKAQTEDVTMKAFNYYVGLEDKLRTKELLDTIDTFTNVRMQEEAHIVYDVFIKKGYDRIEEMEKDLPEMNVAQKAITEYLLSVQYTNKGDQKKAKEYEKLSKKHMEEPLPNKKK